MIKNIEKLVDDCNMLLKKHNQRGNYYLEEEDDLERWYNKICNAFLDSQQDKKLGATFSYNYEVRIEDNVIYTSVCSYNFKFRISKIIQEIYNDVYYDDDGNEVENERIDVSIEEFEYMGLI